MLTRIQVAIIVALTLGIPLLWIYLQGDQLTVGRVAATFGTVVTVVYGIVLLFSLYLWPWPLFRGWLVKRPDLRGSWRVTLHSDWKDPRTGSVIPPLEAYMVVRQSLTTLSIRMFTDKSRSVSIAHSITLEGDGLFTLSAVYRNSPKIEYQGAESAMHHGALLIEVHDVKPHRLEGHYWTDRGTRGTLDLELKANQYFTSFDEAKRVLESAR